MASIPLFDISKCNTYTISSIKQHASIVLGKCAVKNLKTKKQLCNALHSHKLSTNTTYLKSHLLKQADLHFDLQSFYLTMFQQTGVRQHLLTSQKEYKLGLEDTLRAESLNSNSIHSAGNHPVFGQEQFMVKLVMELQKEPSLRRLTRRQRNYISIAFPNIQRIANNYITHIQTQQMNQYVPQIKGLNAPPKNWKPKRGSIKNVTNLRCPISLNVPSHTNMVYLTTNVRNNIATTVYDLNYLVPALREKAESPITRKEVRSWNNVRMVPKTLLK